MGIQCIKASTITGEVQGQVKVVSRLLTKAKWLAGVSALAAGTAVNAAPPLIINTVGAPTVVGSGQGKRAIWTNGGTVAGQAVDIVAVITTATLNHNLSTTSGRPQVTSAGQDKMFVEWRLYQAGTYAIATGTGGVPVNADVHVQFNDVDGPANEEVYLPVCSGAIKWIRIDSTATTGRGFGTISGRAETFSLIGDKGYNNEPVSGVEALYPDTSTFSMGHTGNNGFLVRLDNPSYTVFQTFDYQCADFTPPVAVDDSKEGVPGSPTIISILNNDAIATNNDNGPNNNSGLPSEYAMQSVSLAAPTGATGITTDAKGRTTGFVVPGEGTWAYNAIAGQLTFTPDPSFKGYATNIDYTFTNALGIPSNTAKVTVWYPAIGVTKTSSFNDENGDGFAQVGETIDYIYQVKAYGAEALQNVSVTETGFTGAGTLPIPVYQSGDTNTDNKLDLTETWIYKATYALVASDLTSGTVANSATGTGQTATGTTVTDTSDSSNPADGTGTSGPGPNNGDPTRTPLARAPIIASNDSQASAIFTNSGAVNAYNVLGNDTLKAVTATPSAVTLSVVTPASNAGVTLDTATGQVSVAAGTPAGTYTINYKICEIGNPTNCANAIATVDVTQTNLIVATNDDVAGVNGTTGAPNVLNLFTGDTVNGAAATAGSTSPPAIAANATLRVNAGSSVPTGLTFDAATGNVSVVPGTPAGTYSFQYDICDKLNPTNCATATASVTVVPAAITAATDTPAPVNSASGGTNIINALTNDTLNGNAVIIGDVNLTVTTPASHPGVTLNTATGDVSVASGTPAGTYTIDYKICENLNPTNCANTRISVEVQLSPIAASNDTPAAVSGISGAPSVINAFANDTLGGLTVDPAKITAVVTTPASNLGVALDLVTGLVSVAPNTPAGTYTIGYRICETANPGNCADASVTVIVTAATIAATNDTTPPVNSATGGNNLVDALANDTLNGVAIVLANVNLRITSPASNPDVTLDPLTGQVSVAPGTPAGNYSIGYEVCERLNPTNCATAIVAVVVTATPLVASNDAPAPIDGITGNPSAINALANDTLNGAPVDLAKINTTILTPASNPGVVLNPVTGNVSVAPNTPAGTYTIQYQICESLNPTNCKTATVTVVVTAAPITAAVDAPAPVDGIAGGNDIINALANDTLNGTPVNIAGITLSVTTPASNSGVVLDPATGLVDVAAGTPAGTYTIAYKICERLNSANCADSVVTVVVTAAPIAATPDTPSAINGTTGNPAVINAFVNDTLNGAPVDPARITATVITPASNPGIVLNPATGIVSVAPGTPAGTYTIEYKICETLNPTNCAISTVTVVVEPPVIVAANDSPPAVRSGTDNPSVINAFANDTLNGQPVNPALITASIITPAANPGVVLDPVTGTVSVAANVPPGTYTIAYQICETLNPTNCQTATVTVVVDPPVSAVTGTVYTDGNGNDRLDSGEARRPGWIVEVMKNGVVVGRTVTDVNGEYRIEGLASGAGYTIVFRNPENNVVYDRITNLTLGANTTVVDQNQPIDPSGIIYDSITRAPISGVTVQLTGVNGTPLPTACFVDASQASQTTGASGGYRFDIVPGAAPECPAGETVYRVAVSPPAGYAPNSALLLPQTGPLDPSGLGNPVRVSPDATPPTIAVPTYYLDFRLAAGDPDIINNHIAIDRLRNLTPLIVTKTSIKRSASVGDVVPYEITVRNAENLVRNNVDVVDILPAGMKYVMGTASVNGTPQEPVKTDRQVAWKGQVIPANGSVRYNLTLVVGAGVTGGEKVNTGLAQNGADSSPISNRGTAVVTITPNAVFDCSELLGKVFEDANRNGYQDANEPGVPGVRLATVNGQLITTDEYGRYHIACAAVPDARIGSNFVLKVDTRTLPLGWDTTTDNPRSIRLTRGKFGELNFGVAPKEDSSTSPGELSKNRNEKGE